MGISKEDSEEEGLVTRLGKKARLDHKAKGTFRPGLGLESFLSTVGSRGAKGEVGMI